MPRKEKLTSHHIKDDDPHRWMKPGDSGFHMEARTDLAAGDNVAASVAAPASGGRPVASIVPSKRR